MSDKPEKKTVCRPGRAILSSLSSASVLTALAAVAIAAATLLTSSPDYGCITNVTLNFAFIFIINTAQNINLSKCGIDRKAVDANRKSMDSRLSMTFSDLNILGVTLSVIASTCILVYKYFFGGESVFDSSGQVTAFALSSLLSGAAEAIVFTESLVLLCSRQSIERSFYIICGRSLGVSGDELLKKSCSAVHYEQLMQRVRAAITVRASAVVIFSAVIVMLVFSGLGMPFYPFQITGVYAVALILSDCCGRISDKKIEKKLPVWEKKHISIVFLNTISAVLISFFFVFSFPVQSVFVDYESRDIYDYDEVVEYTIDAFSVPKIGSETAVLFSSLVLILMMTLVVSYAASMTVPSDINDGFKKLGKYRSCALSVIFIAVVAAVGGICFADWRMTPVHVLVTAAFVCLFIMINIAAGLLRLNRKPTR